MCSRHAAEVFPLLRFYQILCLKIKEKFLYKEEASNTASLHRSFQSLEVTTGDFCGVAGTPAAGRGWGCVTLYD